MGTEFGIKQKSKLQNEANFMKPTTLHIYLFDIFNVYERCVTELNCKMKLGLERHLKRLKTGMKLEL